MIGSFFAAVIGLVLAVNLAPVLIGAIAWAVAVPLGAMLWLSVFVHGVITTLFTITVPRFWRWVRFKIMRWFVWKKVMKLLGYLKEHKLMTGSVVLTAVTCTVIIARMIRRNQVKARKENLDEARKITLATRIMVALQSFVGMSYMGAVFYGENATIKAIKEHLTNSMLITRVVQYFEQARVETGVISVTKPSEVKIVIGNKREVGKHSLYVYPFYQKTHNTNDEFFWMKFERDVDDLNDNAFVLWLKKNHLMLHSVSEDLRVWCQRVIDDNTSTIFTKVGELFKRKPKYQNMSEIIEEKVDNECFTPVVGKIRESLYSQKESLFVPLRKKGIANNIINLFILGLPTLAVGIVKFAWVSGSFTKERFIATIFTCVVVFILTILDPIRDKANEVLKEAEFFEMSDFVSESDTKIEEALIDAGAFTPEFIKGKECANGKRGFLVELEGANRRGGKPWRGKRQQRHVKRSRQGRPRFVQLNLTEEEYKALQEEAKRLRVSVSSLVSARRQALQDMEDDAWYAEHPEEEWEDEYDSNEEDEDDYDDVDTFHSKLNKWREDNPDVQVHKTTKRDWADMEESFNNKLKSRDEDYMALKQKLEKTTEVLETYRKEASALRVELNKVQTEVKVKQNALEENKVLKQQAEAHAETKAALTETKKLIEDLLEKQEKKVEKTTTVATLNNVPNAHKCSFCPSSFKTLKKLKGHMKSIHDKGKENDGEKEKLLRDVPRSDKVELRMTYIQIEVRNAQGQWVHQGGAYATTDNGGEGNTKHHNINGLPVEKRGDRYFVPDIRCNIRDLIHPNKAPLKTWDFELLRYDPEEKLDMAVFRLPSDIPSDLLVRKPLRDVPKNPMHVAMSGLNMENGKLKWNDCEGTIMKIEDSEGVPNSLITYRMSTMPGDSGIGVWIWNTESQQWWLCGGHMQEGPPGSPTNVGRLALRARAHLFRPEP